MRLIGVDVDDCIVHMDWKSWCDERAGNFRLFLDNEGKQKEKLPYHLAWHYKGASFDPNDYWRSDTLYDKLSPKDGSVEVLEAISKHFGVVFVSRLKGDHHKSKVEFCKRWFPFMTEFVGTHGKWVMSKSVDCMIEDNYENLKGFDVNKRILIESQYEQPKDAVVNMKFKDWNSFDLKEFFDKYL